MVQAFVERPTFDFAHATYEEAIAEVSDWGDRRGRGLDPLMIPLVASFNLAGVPTIQSCEGHLDHGLPYPWVMFDRPVCACYEKEREHFEQFVLLDKDERDTLEKYHASDELTRAMDRCLHRPDSFSTLSILLAQFYANRPFLQDVMLTIDYSGNTFYRLIPVTMTEFSTQAKALDRFQSEIAAFTAWLKRRIGV